jgi:hypothetical protein
MINEEPSMRIRANDEEGMAMVIALMVSFVLLLLSITVVAQSIHAVNGSSYDRRRLTSLDAAEAGGNYYYAYLQSIPAASVSCSALTQTIASSPVAASFTATPTFYDASTPTPNVMTCPFTDATYPASVLVNTTGTVSGQTPRTMQTYIRLTPVYSGFGAAVETGTGVSLSNNFDIYGNSGNDGDIYILTGDLNITNTPHVRGNVYVPNGSATISNNSGILGNLWANTNVTVNGPATVTGNVTSSTGSISGSGSIGGTATAATTISGVSVTGTKYPNTVSPQPPSQTFPHITFTATDNANWVGAGYTVVTFSGPTACSDARNYVEGGSVTTDTVVRITGANPCTYSNSNNATITMGHNLAIITDWGVNLAQTSDWNGASTNKSLFFISTWPSNGCPSGSANKDISTGNNTNFNSFVQVSFYTPCTASMNNQNNYYGQVLGGSVSIGNNYTMTYRPVLVPGYGTVTSFREDIAYVRESS